MIELRSVVGNAFTYGEPLVSAANEVSRAVWCRNGPPRGVIVKSLHHWFYESSELVDYVAECARLRLECAEHLPRLWELLGHEGRVVGFVEEEVGEISLRALARSLRERGVLPPVGLALCVARAMASAWRALELSAPRRRMTAARESVRFGWDGAVRLLADPHPGPNEQIRGAAVALMHGSFQWLAPEIVTGAPALSTSAMFAIGMMMFEALTCHYPFGDENTLAILSGLLEKPLPPIARSDVPPEVVALVETCAKKNAADRFPTWSALIAAIDAAAQHVESFDAADLRALVTRTFPNEAAQASRRADEIAAFDPERLQALRASLANSGLEALSLATLDVPLARREDELTPTPIRPRTPGLADTAVDAWGRDARAMVRAGPSLLVDLRCVTCAEYARFVIATSHPPPDDWDGPTPPPTTEDAPVTRVTPSDARAYARWAGKRLPSNDDWERAVQAVGADRLGVGEVWELTSSGFGSPGWIVRGGRWRDRPHEVARAENRSFEDRPASDVGFRCVAVEM